MNQTFTKNLWGEFLPRKHDYFLGHYVPTLKAKAGLCAKIATKIPS